MRYETDSVSLALRCLQEEDATHSTLMLFLHVNDNKQIEIFNIFLPTIMRKQGLGMKMIEIAYSVAVEYGYRLLIVDMVRSFYCKMIKKGAIVVVENDAIEIVENTHLYSNRNVL